MYFRQAKTFTTSISFYHKYKMLNSIIEKLFLHRKDFTFFAWESYVLSWVEKLVVTNLPFYTLILSQHMCLIRKSSSCSVSFSLDSKIWLSKCVVIEGIYDNIINPYLEKFYANQYVIVDLCIETLSTCILILSKFSSETLTVLFLEAMKQNLFQNELHKRWKMYNISNALFKRISMEDAHTLHFEHYCLHWLLLSIHLNLSLFYAKLPPAYDLIRYLLFLAVMIQLCINLEA